MPTYTPFNSFVFLQAFAGAVAGLLGQSNSLSTARGSNTDTIEIAGAWAQSLDTVWGTAQNPDQFEYDEILVFSTDLFMVYNPNVNSTLPATFTQTANALLTALDDGETYLTSIGITPGLIPIAGVNEADVSDATIAAPGVGPATFCFVAMLMTAKQTGVFDISWAYPWNSGTTADSVTLAVVAEGWSGANWALIASTGKIVLANQTAIGNVGSGVGAAVNGGTAPGISTATTAGTAIGATFTGASPSSSTVATVTQPTLTGLLTAQGMQWQSGQASVRLGSGNAAAAAGFALGSPVLIRFEVSATNTITMTGGASFKVTERTAA